MAIDAEHILNHPNYSNERDIETVNYFGYSNTVFK